MNTSPRFDDSAIRNRYPAALEVGRSAILGLLPAHATSVGISLFR
jgi:hypothetical protein